MNRVFLLPFLLAAAVALAGLSDYGHAGIDPTVSATQQQALVGGAIESLKLKPVKSDRIGGPQKYTVTKETLEFLKDKVVIVNGEGDVEVVKAK